MNFIPNLFLSFFVWSLEHQILQIGMQKEKLALLKTIWIGTASHNAQLLSREMIGKLSLQLKQKTWFLLTPMCLGWL